jgi:D-glycerate 3-kinase
MPSDLWLEDFIQTKRLGSDFAAEVDRTHVPLATAIADRARAARAGFVVGLCGPQGSGKSTLVEVTAHLLGATGLKVAVLSIDDLYLPLARRETLGLTIHPLLKTRGPPGTHDVALGMMILDGLARAGMTSLPRFDKAADDRKPEADWDRVEGPVDVILLEGWCVGAAPQPQAALANPVNALERDEDQQGVWRRYVNAALAGDYQRLFRRIDLFVLLQPTSFDVVAGWRVEQERKLAEDQPTGSAVMSEAQVHRFVAHYERITRWIMTEAPGRADVVIRINETRHALAPLWRP